MRLKTQVIQLIMQFPGIFQNALCVYNHLFYTVGNGFLWSNGELREKGFRKKSERKCIQELVDFYTDMDDRLIKEWEKMKGNEVISEEKFNWLVNNQRKFTKQRIEEGTYTIKHAKELSEEFTPTVEFTSFHHIYNGYSACTTIPDNIKSDWLEGINFINQLREKLIKENPKLDSRYDK